MSRAVSNGILRRPTDSSERLSARVIRVAIREWPRNASPRQCWRCNARRSEHNIFHSNSGGHVPRRVSESSIRCRRFVARPRRSPRRSRWEVAVPQPSKGSPLATRPPGPSFWPCTRRFRPVWTRPDATRRLGRGRCVTAHRGRPCRRPRPLALSCEPYSTDRTGRPGWRDCGAGQERKVRRAGRSACICWALD